MKRMVCLLLILLLLLSGCSHTPKEPAVFYYLRDTYQQTMDSPICGESREVNGHRDNLKYLLSFYLMGPVSKGLHSPLPRGTMLLSLTEQKDTLTIEISNTTALLSESEFSLACACLAMTCMGLSDVGEVTVNSGSRSVTLRQDTLLLTDTVQLEENTR